MPLEITETNSVEYTKLDLISVSYKSASDKPTALRAIELDYGVNGRAFIRLEINPFNRVDIQKFQIHTSGGHQADSALGHLDLALYASWENVICSFPGVMPFDELKKLVFVENNDAIQPYLRLLVESLREEPFRLGAGNEAVFKATGDALATIYGCQCILAEIRPEAKFKSTRYLLSASKGDGSIYEYDGEVFVEIDKFLILMFKHFKPQGSDASIDNNCNFRLAAKKVTFSRPAGTLSAHEKISALQCWKKFLGANAGSLGLEQSHIDTHLKTLEARLYASR